VLSRIQEEASDTRIPIMEQFEKANPALLKYGTNMVRQGMDHQLPEVLLRREATDRMLAVLGTGGSRSNILMNAGSGEGKTFAVNGLAQRIADNDVPTSMKNTQMVQLNMGALLGGNQFQGSLETKAEEIFKPLNKYLSDNPSRKVVVFIDEIHMIGELLDTMKSSGILEKPNLSFIGATTPDDWRKSPLRSDQAFQGRFHELALPSFNNKEKLAILGQVGTKLAHKTGVAISPEILEQTMLQSAAKWPENGLRHATDLLGLSVSLAKGQPLELASLKDRVQHKELWINTLKAQKTLKGRFERQMKETETEVETLKRQIEAMEQMSETTTSQSVKDKHLRQAMAVLTGERIGVLSQDELVKLRQAKEIMSQFIVGQPNALGTIEEALREIAVRQKTGAVHNRPIASMLLCGPTGVGKTEVSKVIAKEFMNNNMLRLDMSDYMEKHNVSLLKGSPPGYVGHEDGGMVDEIRKNPNSVIVFDEIEKAHPDIFNVLLQILGEGELRDNKNQVVNFRNTLIVLTSNLHNKEIIELMTKKLQKAAKGSAAQKDPALAMRELETKIRQVLTINPAEGREGFRPEHLGRVDYVIPFNPLTKHHVSDILDIRLREINQSPFLKDNNLIVTLSDRARARLVDLTAASSLPAKPVKSKAPEPAPATSGPNGRRKKAVVPPPANDNTPLQGGARDVRINFDRFVNKKVFTDLTFEDHLIDVENAQLVVDYDPKTQAFKVEAKPNTPIKQEKKAGSGRTLAFA
jgi:ATP-dependent Clp protease ATP-binding subunit ClpC